MKKLTTVVLAALAGVVLATEKATIALPENPGAVATYAATEIRDYVEKSTGERWTIVTNAPTKTGVRFAFVEDATLGEEGFRLNERDGVVTIAASPKRGVLYGAYDYLERFVGVRWYSSDTERVPKRKTVDVPKGFALESVPDFRMRNAFWYDVINNADFAARLRNNANAPFEAKHGGLPYRFGKGVWACHTFGSTLLPSAEFFEKHPEYFGFRDGKRDGANQPCLTNPDVLRIVTERVKDIVRKDPGARFYGVSQDDHQRYCECERCAAVDAEEGSHAGCVVRFVNAVAEAVEKEFPGVIIETLAYQYSRFPTKKTKFRHNVVPCVCSIECGFGPDPIAAGTTDYNARFVECLKGWGRQTDEIYLWDYVTNFRNFHHFFPNLGVLQANLKFFHDNKVRYMFEQGDHVGRRAFMAELQAYVQSRWMWDLDLPAEELVRDFTDGYYGAGGVYVRQFLKELDDTFREYCLKHPGFAALIYETMEERVYDEAFVRRAEELWAKAEAAAKDDPIALRNVRAGAVSVAWERFHLTPNAKSAARLDALSSAANARRWSEGLAFTRTFETRLANYLPRGRDLKKPGWELVFDEEFVARTLDRNTWKREGGERPESCRVENGCLVLEAGRTPVAIHTDKFPGYGTGFDFMYGRVEVRAKAPAGKGATAAVRTIGADIHNQKWPWCGEIDILEFAGGEPNRARGAAQWSDKSVKTADGHRRDGGFLDLPRPLSEDFHVYAMEWDETSIRFEVDGKVYHTIATDKLDPNIHDWPPFNQYHFLKLDLASDGSPARLLVDYVRVYKKARGADFRIRDPYILVDSGKYYLYESYYAGDAIKGYDRGVYVRESEDLENWSEPSQVLSLPPEFDCSAVWAPEVHKFNGEYWLFVTLTQSTNVFRVTECAPGADVRNLTPRGTWVFKAPTAWARFKPVKDGPIPPRERMTLDGTLYVEDGKPYMVYCHEWCQMENGTIEYALLKEGFADFAEPPRKLLDARSAMPGAGNVTDGPFFWRSEKSGKLYLIWSNFVKGKGYSVLIRRSDSGKIAGPWTKDRVLYDKNGGHAMIFRDLDGKLRLALHQPNTAMKERIKIFDLVDDGEWLSLAEDIRFEAVSDHTNCLYACGETASVTVSAKDESGKLVREGLLPVRVDNFGAAVVTNYTVDLSQENPFTVRISRQDAGFSRLTVSDFVWGVGFDVGGIRPGTPYPDDFMDFWRTAIAKYDREIPNDIETRVDEKLSDETWIVERLTMSAFGNRKVYGYVTRERKATGRRPAVVCVPGAGYGHWSQAPSKVEGFVSLMVAVLPFEPDAACGRRADYDAVSAAAQAKWGVKTYAQGGISASREDYFFYPVILACNRAIDWFAARADVDAAAIRYNGTSQGGGMGLALMALNRHFLRGSVFVPAITDLLGFKVGGRQSGWPELVENQRPENRAAAELNAPYFCGVNFARQIRTPIRFCVGYSDVTCPPNAVYSAYNACPSADKNIVGGIGMGHNVRGDCSAPIIAWLLAP